MIRTIITTDDIIVRLKSIEKIEYGDILQRKFSTTLSKNAVLNIQLKNGDKHTIDMEGNFKYFSTILADETDFDDSMEYDEEMAQEILMNIIISLNESDSNDF